MLNQNDVDEMFNVGVGDDISIGDLAKEISNIVGYKGAIKFDANKPDGTMQKLLDCSNINQLGWMFNADFRTGLEKTINWYKKKGQI